ncbi:MAG: hypothetical protein ACFFED_08890 [Candidatus Thorarchaeota archaeon]
MGEGVQEVVPKNGRFIALVVLVFVLLFAFTPFMIVVRLSSYEIRSPFYWIRSNSMGFLIDAPFPVGMNYIPNPFLWMDWIMIIFMLVLVGYYLGWTSERTAKRIGWLSMGPGIVTFFVNLLGVAFGGGLIIAIPIPIPAIVGLVILKVYPCEYSEPWPEEAA